jgi:integrase
MAVWIAKKKGKEHLGWWVFTKEHGRRSSKLVGDERTARSIAKDLREQRLRRTLHLPAQNQTVGPYFDSWLSHHAMNLKSATLEFYRGVWRVWLQPFFAGQQIAVIDKRLVREFIAQMHAAGKSRAYIKGTLAPLSVCLTQAIEDGLLVTNPIIGALPKQRGEKQLPIGRAYSREQLAVALKTCYEMYPRYYPLFLLYARAGLRLREGLALQWQDLDFERLQIRVSRSLIRKGGGFQTTKGVRYQTVDMSKQLAKALIEIRPRDAKPTDLVFVSRKGTPLSDSNIRKRVWYKVLAQAGLPRIRIHDLRHTFATRLLEEGQHLAYVQQQLRHASIKTTVDIYGHLTPGYNRGAVDKLDDGESEG